MADMKFRLWPKKRWERVTLVICGVIILLIGIAYAYLNDGMWTHYRMKSVEAEYRKSLPWTVEEIREPITDSDNAAYFMRNSLLSTQWMGLIKNVKDVRKAIRAGDYEEARRWLADYQVGLPRLDEASRMGDFALVREWEWGRRGGPGFYPFSLTVDLIRYQGLIEAHDGDFDLANGRAEMLDRFAGLYVRDLSFNGQLGAIEAMKAADEVRGEILFRSRGKWNAESLERGSGITLDLEGAWRGESYMMLADARNLGENPEDVFELILDRQRWERKGALQEEYSVTELGRSYQVRVMEASLGVQEKLRTVDQFDEAIEMIADYEKSIPYFPETMHGAFVLFPDTLGLDQRWRGQQVRARALGVVRRAVDYWNAEGEWPGSVSNLGGVGAGAADAWMEIQVLKSKDRLFFYSVGLDGADEAGKGDDIIAFDFKLD